MAFDGLSAEQRTAVETFVDEWLTQHQIPGAAVAIVDENSIAAEGFGARTLTNNTPVTQNTLFGIASCTKPFTATAIMQLVEVDEIGLNDPVTDYIPHLADAPGNAITIEELLTHTSGMPSDGMAGHLTTRWLGVGGAEIPLSSEADFRRHVQQSIDRRVTDRDTFFYYNSGYVMLGQIIETVTGQAYATYVEDEILSPLGMDRSTFDRDTFEADGDSMTPYIKQDGESTEVGFPFDPLIRPAGGLISSVRELSEYMQAVLGGEAVADDGVLIAESVAAMTTPVGTLGTYFDGREVGYGYGLSIETFLDDRLVGHRGSIGASNAWFGYLEDANLGVAIACTTSPETHPLDAGMGILALLQGETPDAVQPHYRLMAALESVTGEYAGYRNTIRATVERVGGGLKIEAEGAGERLLTPTRIEEDLLVCTTVVASGMQREARFEFSGETVDMFFEWTQLTKAA